MTLSMYSISSVSSYISRQMSLVPSWLSRERAGLTDLSIGNFG